MLYDFPLCSTIFFYLIFRATNSDFNTNYAFCHLLNCSVGKSLIAPESIVLQLTLPKCSHYYSLGHSNSGSSVVFSVLSQWFFFLSWLELNSGCWSTPSDSRNTRRCNSLSSSGKADIVLSSSLSASIELYIQCPLLLSFSLWKKCTSQF